MAAAAMSHLFSLLIILFSFIALFTTSSCSDDDLVSDLLYRQSQSETGVIHLNDQLISQFLSSKTPRSYSLIIFFDALQLHDKAELHLKSLLKEFDLLSSSFIENNKDNPSSRSKLFFCKIEFKESQSTFAKFGVNSLPHIRIVPPTAVSLKDDSFQMDAGEFSRLADAMVQFVESKTNLIVGPLHRPPVLSKKQVVFIIVALLICFPFAVKKFIAGETILHSKKLWMGGAVFVYFFSVSGTMHNIIRKMPMFMTDRNDPNKLVFFYKGTGMQLGAEGFSVGFLYTVVGLLLALVVHLLVKARNANLQRTVMLFAIAVSFWSVKKVIFLDNWKTGYTIHMYWPSSW